MNCFEIINIIVLLGFLQQLAKFPQLKIQLKDQNKLVSPQEIYFFSNICQVELIKQDQKKCYLEDDFYFKTNKIIGLFYYNFLTW